MKNLKISKKLLVTFGIIIVLLLATILLSLLGLISVSKNFTYFYNKPYNVTNSTMDMRRDIQSSVKNLGYTLISNDKDKKNEFADQANLDIKNIEEDIVFVREHFTGDKTLVDNFEKLMNDSEEIRTTILNLARDNKNSEASSLYFSKYHPILLEAQQYLIDINKAASSYADTTYNKAMDSAGTTVYGLIAISLLAIIITVLLAVYTTRSLTKPIFEIEKVAKDMVSGNLNVNISYDSKDELGSLSNSMRDLTHMIKEIICDMSNGLTELSNGNFAVKSNAETCYIGDFKPLYESINKIIHNLNYTISQINLSSEEVANGADQVSCGAQELSQGATEQASSIEELSATIAEISTQINKNAENATNAKIQTEQAGIKITESTLQMQKMIDAMSNISEKSIKIENIIKTIDNIAFQTNILALNAAVEAARAGVAGKGFGVVAEEVRNLAAKSAEAAKTTSTLIEESITAVEDGVKLADVTAKSMLTIVDGANSVASLVDSIASASNEQAEAVHQITQGIEQISAVIQTNTATAEESAAASEELSSQAQILKLLISKFKLKQ